MGELAPHTHVSTNSTSYLYLDIQGDPKSAFVPSTFWQTCCIVLLYCFRRQDSRQTQWVAMQNYPMINQMLPPSCYYNQWLIVNLLINEISWPMDIWVQHWQRLNTLNPEPWLCHYLTTAWQDQQQEWSPWAANLSQRRPSPRTTETRVRCCCGSMSGGGA